MPYDPNRRVPIVHVCQQEAKIAHLEAYEVQQNGAVKDLAKSYRELDGKVDLILERIPHDLHQRLRAVEGDTYRRTGATGMLKWVLGLVGVGTLMAGYNFIIEETSPLEGAIHDDGSQLMAVAILAVLVAVVGLFAYLTRRRS